jgi:hypothetical protein
MFTCRRRKVLAAHLPAETLAALEERGPMVVRDQMAVIGIFVSYHSIAV